MFKPDICRVCGCTEDQPCIIGEAEEDFSEATACYWIDEARTLCSNPKCLAVVPLAQLDALLGFSVLEAERA